MVEWVIIFIDKEIKFSFSLASVVESADATDLKSVGSNTVPVQVWPFAYLNRLLTCAPLRVRFHECRRNKTLWLKMRHDLSAETKSIVIC